MTDFEKAEFWAALGRLYDRNLELTKSIEELTRNTDALRVVVLSHEKRHNKIDEIVEWLHEKERKREQQEGRN
ncbi:MAG: hypothetical protein M3Y27_12540 [Acidobacteriota bacterium]|nr:hypothetical protein [Acidobacteriota bacterium]